jgi:ATP-dependent Clp protease ATP-binding subunit ClpA
MNLNQYTIKAQEAVQAAQQLAYNNQNANIETAHLLKAILGDKDSPTDFLLKKNNLRHNKKNKTRIKTSIIFRIYYIIHLIII